MIKAIEMFNSENVQIIRNLAVYIHKAFDKRKEHL